MTAIESRTPVDQDADVLKMLRNIAHDAQQKLDSEASSKAFRGKILAALAGVGPAVAGGGFAFADDIQHPWTLVFARRVAAVSAVDRSPEQATSAQRDANLLETYQRWVDINERYDFADMSPEERCAQVLDFANWLDRIKGAEVPADILKRLRARAFRNTLA